MGVGVKEKLSLFEHKMTNDERKLTNGKMTSDGLKLSNDAAKFHTKHKKLTHARLAKLLRWGIS